MKKNIIYTIAGMIILYLLIWVMTPKPTMPIEYKKTIDSLTKINEKLIENQKKLDSSINQYEKKVDQIDSSINNIKEKTTVIKEYHHQIIERTKHYNTTQLDSFFKTKYNY